MWMGCVPGSTAYPICLTNRPHDGGSGTWWYLAREHQGLYPRTSTHPTPDRCDQRRGAWVVVVVGFWTWKSLSFKVVFIGGLCYKNPDKH